MDRRQLASEINSKVNIADVVGRYVQLTKSGRNHKGLCPFHNEATPSFLVSEEKGIYKCFGCGEGGDAISFVSKMDGIPYGEAMTRLAADAGVGGEVLRQLKQKNLQNDFTKELEILKFAEGFYRYYLMNTEEGKKAQQYLEQRGITKETMTDFGIGLAPRDGQLLLNALTTNGYALEFAKKAGLVQQGESGAYYSPFRARILFSVANERGDVIGFSGRTYLPEDAGGAKYVNSPESPVFQKSKVLYRLHEARKTARTSGRLLLFEGFMDVIAASKSGFSESIATMGTALTAEHVSQISRHAKEVVLVFDGDEAGLGATSKAIPILLSHQLQVRVTRLPEGIDPDDYVKQEGAHKFSERIERAMGAIDFQYAYLKRGIRLDTSDGQLEFERRLTAFGNQLTDKNILQIVLRKWQQERSNLMRRSRDDEKPNQGGGFYRRSRGEPAAQPPLSSAKLPVVPSDVKAEKELIYYMMRDRDVFELVMAQIGTAFNVPAHRKIAQAIEAYYFTNKKLEQEAFLMTVEPTLARLVREMVVALSGRPASWSKKMIDELIEKIQQGARKLEQAGKKQMFYNASYDEQLRILSELTVGQYVD